jgi:hypothetical protein
VVVEIVDCILINVFADGRYKQVSVPLLKGKEASKPILIIFTKGNYK